MGTEKSKVSVPTHIFSHPPANPPKRADVFVRKHTYILYVSVHDSPSWHLYILAGGASAYYALLPGLSIREPPFPLIFVAR
jgi:hypothetical protein